MKLRILRELRKYLVYLGIVLLLMIVLLLLRTDVIQVVAVILMIIIASLSKVYKRVTTLSIGFELVTPFTLIFAYKVGILFAIITALFMLIASEFISGRLLPHALMFQIIAYVIIAVVAGALNSLSFVPLAIGLIIFRNLFLFVTGIFIAGTDPFKMFLGTFPNIFINGFIVAKAGKMLLSLL